MMTRDLPLDICQTPVDLDDRAARAAWDGVILGFLAHSAVTPTHLGKTLELAPGFAMGWAAKGLFSLMLGRREMIPVAQEALRDALRCAPQDLRSRAWTAALAAWLKDRPSDAATHIETVLARYPQDTLSAKVSQAIRFILGDAHGMRSSVEAVVEAHGTGHACRGYLLGCHAFALEETGDYAAAEATGLEGLTYAADDAWGLHAVAHVYDMTAQPDRGLALINGNVAAWDHCNNFRYHVWWHKALLHLDRGEIDKVMSLYDTKIRADKTDDFRDIANATSLLMRLELEGADVGARWHELADLAENRTQDGCVVFADLHYMLALGAAGRFDAASEMTIRFTSDARAPGDMAQRVADPGLAALAGLHSFAEGRYDTAFLNLAAARAKMPTIGGSHAQRDVFERMTIDAGLRAGFYDETREILAQRTAQRDGHEDHFAETRSAALAVAQRIPAQ